MADATTFTSKLQNKKVLIIGGSSGVVYAVAQGCLENGANVTISSSNPSRVEAAVKSLQSSYPSKTSQIQGFACDLSKREGIESNILNLLSQTGGLDHIVFTAGEPIPPTPISEATLEAIDNAATVRYIASIMLAKHAPKFLKSSFQSSITLTTGVVTSKPIPNWSVIAGARQAVIGLGRNLALDLKSVRVNVIALGAVDTETWNVLPAEAKEKAFRALVEKGTTGRIAEASDVAEAYLYCMRDRNVTGAVIESNGGVLLT